VVDAAVDDVVAAVVVVGPTTAKRQLSYKDNAQVEQAQIDYILISPNSTFYDIKQKQYFFTCTAALLHIYR